MLELKELLIVLHSEADLYFLFVLKRALRPVAKNIANINFDTIIISNIPNNT